MADKFIPCINPYDNLALLAEILRTMRLIAGLEPGVYDESRGGVILPDDLEGKKAPKAKRKTKAEKKAEKEAAAKAEKADVAETETTDEPKAEDPEPEKKAEKAKGK